MSDYRKELESLRKKHGEFLNPHHVLSFAKNPKTALHARFDWDDSEAARKWRHQQAERLIRVVVTILPNTTQPTRAYVSLLPDRKATGGYRRIEDVMASPRLREMLLDQARREMQTFIAKYRHLEELTNVITAMEEATAPTKATPPTAKRRKTPARQRVAAPAV